MDEFNAHWEDVNLELGGAPATDLKLQGSYARAMFLADRNAIDTAMTGLVGLENTRGIAAQNRDTAKQGLVNRLNQFRGLLRALLPGSSYGNVTPLVPPFSSAESTFLRAFDDMGNVWLAINADTTIPGFTPPLLIGTSALALFQTELAAMRTGFVAVTTAENDERIAREKRDALLPPARERMVQYRAMVEVLLGPTHPLTLSLPDIWPLPGSTPAAVTLSGAWNAGLGQAVFNWTASLAATLSHYELRMSPGATYDSATATVVGNNIPPGTTTFATAAGLAAAGDMASFKLFVILTTGNEAGSNTVTITRA
jgi:hypothetical protein